MRILKQQAQSRRPSLPHPFRSVTSLPPSTPLSDIDSDSIRTHTPLPTFTIADPQALFQQAKTTMDSPTSPVLTPKSKQKVLNKMGTFGKKVVKEVLGGPSNSPRLRGDLIPTYGRGGAARPKLGQVAVPQAASRRVESTIGRSSRANISVTIDTAITSGQSDLTRSITSTSDAPSWQLVGSIVSDSVLPRQMRDFDDLPSPTAGTVGSQRRRSQSRGRTDFLSMFSRSRSPSRNRSPLPPVPPLPTGFRCHSNPPASPHNFVPVSGPSRASNRRKSRPSPLHLTVDLFQPRPRHYDSVHNPFLDASTIGRSPTPSMSVALPPTPTSDSNDGRGRYRPFSETVTSGTEMPRGRTRGRGRRISATRSLEARPASTEANHGSDEARRAALVQEPATPPSAPIKSRRPLPSPPAPHPRIPPLSSTPADMIHAQGARYSFSDYHHNPRDSLASNSTSSVPLSYRTSSGSRQPYDPLPAQPGLTPMALPLPLSPLASPPFNAGMPPTSSPLQMQQALEFFVALANANLQLAAASIAASTPTAQPPPPLPEASTRPTTSMMMTAPAPSHRDLARLSAVSTTTGSAGSGSGSSSGRSRYSLAPSQQTPTPPGSPRTVPRGATPSMASTNVNTHTDSTATNNNTNRGFRLSLYPETIFTTSSLVGSPISEDPDISIIPPVPPLPPPRVLSSTMHAIDTRPSTAMSDDYYEDEDDSQHQHIRHRHERPHSWIAEVLGWEEIGKEGGLGIAVDDFVGGGSATSAVDSSMSIRSETETSTVSSSSAGVTYKSELPSPMMSPVRGERERVSSPVPRGPRTKMTRVGSLAVSSPAPSPSRNVRQGSPWSRS